MAQYRAEGALGAGAFVVPQPRWCTGISAFAAEGVADATISVNGGVPVPIPPGGVTNLNPPLGTLKAPTITFVNTAGYGVETVE
jgi:hypothetical protein